LKTGASQDDSAASLLNAIVCTGKQGFSGIERNGPGALVQGTGVLILFTSQETRPPAPGGVDGPDDPDRDLA